MISGNGYDGLDFQNAYENVIAGNLIGTDATGSYAVANGWGNDSDGIELEQGSSGNTIGGTASGAGNVISGNTDDGVEITGSGTTGNVVAGDFIGTDVSGTMAIPNGNGVEIDTNAAGNTIGGTTALARDIISGNTGYGVLLYSRSASNVVEGDYIGTDMTGDAPLGNLTGIYITSADNTIGGTATARAT